MEFIPYLYDPFYKNTIIVYRMEMCMLMKSNLVIHSVELSDRFNSVCIFMRAWWEIILTGGMTHLLPTTTGNNFAPELNRILPPLLLAPCWLAISFRAETATDAIDFSEVFLTREAILSLFTVFEHWCGFPGPISLKHSEHNLTATGLLPWGCVLGAPTGLLWFFEWLTASSLKL